MDFRDSKKARGLICLALLLVTAAVYWRVSGFDFVNFDDPDYVTENPMVKQGLAPQGVEWAFTHFYAGNWHPLTWISHMADCQFFGMNAGGHHLVNVGFHAANAVLVFLLLCNLTGAQWRSAIVAGLFALHPLHVESVAWVSERKDVLSTFFGLLAVMAYVRFAEKSKVQSPKSKAWYICALGFFALSLLAKPMLMTLPFVLLLLDFWPLARGQVRGVRLLILEKAPFFLLAVVSCVVTFLAQKTGGAVMSAEHFPLGQRVENAISSYFLYFLKAIWPDRLAVFYPLHEDQSVGMLIAGIVFLLVVSLAALVTMKKWPFFLVGWLWFLGTLVPVIGLVQVGGQAMADRYTYVPLIGIFIAVVWGVSELLRRVKAGALVGGVVAGIVLALFAVCTVTQLHYWQNSLMLFTHALAVTRDNAAANNNLGTALAAAGRKDEALAHYKEAARIEPKGARYQNNFATALARAGQRDAAIEHYQAAIRADPQYAEAFSNLGVTFLAQHRLEEAVTNLYEAVRIDPSNGETRNNLGNALSMQGKPNDALAQYAEALRLNPTNATIHLNAGLVLVKLGRTDEALNRFAEAVRLNPASAEAHYEMGRQLFLRGQNQSASQHLGEAVKLKPENASAEFYLGLALLELRDEKSGLDHLRVAARLRPGWVDVLNAQAWVLATSESDKLRDGAEAVRLAEKAAELTSRQQPVILNTLAAAYAEAGRFDDAVAAAGSALELSERGGQTNLVVKIQEALALYKAHLALRQKGEHNN